VNDPSVLFVSTHQSGAYPGTGRMSEVGKGDAEGATINLPLPARPYAPLASCSLAVTPHSASQAAIDATEYSDEIGCACAVCPVPLRAARAELNKRNSDCTGDTGGAAMSAAFEEVVAPAAERFRPDIILVGSPFCD